jgi:ABC-type uncharacterized transport system YnjBCD permease subunit
MFNLGVNKTLGPRAFLVFQRVVRYNNQFTILAALVAGLSLAVLSFGEFHPSTSSFARGAEGLLCSSSITAVVSVTLAIMLLFRFESYETATRKDLAIAWLPLVLLDLSILEFLIGLVLWYSSKNEWERSIAMAVQTVVLLGATIGVAIGMWQSMSRLGGLGADENLIKQRK